MSKLGDFLRPITTEKTQEVVVSDRFVDESGNSAKITIKAIFQAENQALLKMCTRAEKDPKGQYYDKFDNDEYRKRLIVACTTVPDFKEKEICDVYGCVDPLDVPGKMFFSGEYTMLVKYIMDINGYKDIDELSEEAKNF